MKDVRGPGGFIFWIFSQGLMNTWALHGVKNGARSHALPHAGFPCFKDAFVI